MNSFTICIFARVFDLRSRVFELRLGFGIVDFNYITFSFTLKIAPLHQKAGGRVFLQRTSPLFRRFSDGTAVIARPLS